MNYQQSLDYIFSTYMAVKDVIKGKPYQEYKNTQIFKDLLVNLKLTIDSEKVIKITGSKGKGTCARTLARTLEQQGYRVGLFTSPEELEHTDRISINGEDISLEEFAKFVTEMQSTLDQYQTNFTQLDYFSPYGLFLLVAIHWFTQEKVDWLIIECGRGVRYDDSNAIDGKLGIITSILPEHLDYFGPSLEDVYNDKIAIKDSSEILLTWKDINEDIELDAPRCFNASAILAKMAAKILLSKQVELVFESASYGKIKNHFYDCVIHADAIDIEWVKQHRDCTYFISIPDDKDFDNILSKVQSLGVDFNLVCLRGIRGYLDYKKTKTCGLGFVEFDYNHPHQLQDYLSVMNIPKMVFWGTQTFIRFVKKCFV
jgi:hypothetical protein